MEKLEINPTLSKCIELKKKQQKTHKAFKGWFYLLNHSSMLNVSFVSDLHQSVWVIRWNRNNKKVWKHSIGSVLFQISLM